MQIPRILLTVLLPLIIAGGVLVTVPWRICARPAESFFRGDLEVQRALGVSAAAWLERDEQGLEFHTGASRFDGEWYLIIHMAAALGFLQTAQQHPELAERHLGYATRATERLLLPKGRAHDREAWGEDALSTLDRPRGHLAFLSYANLALSMHQAAKPNSPFRAQNHAITEALARKYWECPTPLLESYPDETYPADNAAALASILVYDRAHRTDHGAQIRRALEALRTTSVDPGSGLLFQRIDSRTGVPQDAARGSGTAMAAFVLWYAGPGLARPFWEALQRQSTDYFGFGGIREYVLGTPGSGDIDSGPVVLGLSVSASGFALASARRFEDQARFTHLFASAWLFGLPVHQRHQLRFASGGPLGDVLMFALLTAPRGS